MSKHEKQPIIVDADETESERLERRIREIHEEVACHSAINHLEHQMRYDKRREDTDEFWAEWERKHGSR